MVSEQEAKDAIRSWVISRAKSPAPDQIDETTPLFAQRHLSSLHVPELMLLLERLRGKPIDPEGLGPGDFRNIETIVRRFCVPLCSADAAPPCGDKEGTHAGSNGDLG